MNKELNEAMEMLGNKTKYFGAKVIDIEKEYFDIISEKLLTLFSIRCKDKNDLRNEYLSFTLMYNKAAENWNILNHEDLNVPYNLFHSVIDIIRPVGVISEEFKIIKINLALATRKAGIILPNPKNNIASRFLFNFYQPGTFFLYSDKDCNPDSFFVRKYMPRNTFVLLGNSDTMNYYLKTKGGPHVFLPHDAEIRQERGNKDIRKPKIPNFNRVSFTLDICKITENTENVNSINENVNKLKKVNPRKRRRKNKNNKEPVVNDKEILENIKEDITKIVSEINK